MVNPAGNTVYFNNISTQFVDTPCYAMLAGPNVFMGQNDFAGFAPTVSTVELLDGPAVEGVQVADSSYYVSFGATVAAKQYIDALAVPIGNALAGDTIVLTVFLVSAVDRSVLVYACRDQATVVTPTEADGQCCAVVAVGMQFDVPVAVGLHAARRAVAGRTIGLMYDEAGGQNSCWHGDAAPGVGQALVPDRAFRFAYRQAKVVRSAVATKADLKAQISAQK